MKNLLLFIAFIACSNANGQNFQKIQEAAPAIDSQVVNGKVYDSDGFMSGATYVGLFNRPDLKPDGYWVIQPTDDTSTRWVLLVRPSSKTVSTSSYTVAMTDFKKTINLTNTGGRTVTMPIVTAVNSTDAVWIKDASNTASANNITIQSTDLIDGQTTAVINNNGGVLGIYRSGNTWKIQ